MIEIIGYYYNHPEKKFVSKNWNLVSLVGFGQVWFGLVWFGWVG
jgi:hypothetical protein